MDNQQKGEVARLKVLLRAAELGASISIPMIDVRYDCIIDWESRLYRAQIKYADAAAAKSSGSVFLNLTKGGKVKRRYESHEIDVLLVYLPKTDKVYWFGPDVFHRKLGIHVRYEPTKSGQKAKTLMADDHIW